MIQHTSPCGDCPFRRTIQPGRLGGSPVGMFIGQANGQFWLPCHCHTDYNDPNWKTDLSKPQCAGTAVFRSNVGKPARGNLLHLPADTKTVFSSFAEFLAHHQGISVGLAQIYLDRFTPDMWTNLEYRKAGAVLHLVPKQPNEKERTP